MVGGVLHGFGRIFLIAGILLLVAGGTVAGYGVRAAQATHEAGDGTGEQGAARNTMLQTAGGAAAAAGLHVLVVGAILLASGRSQARQQQRQAMACASGPEGLEEVGESAPRVVDVGGATARGRKVAVMLVALIGLLAVVLAVGMAGRG